MPCAASRSATSRPRVAIGPTVTISTSRWGASRSTSTPSSVRRDRLRAHPRPIPFGNRITVGASSTATASPSSSRSRAASRGAAMRMSGHDLQYRKVPHAVVARTVRPGHPGPVEHEGDTGLVQSDIHQDLVERTVHEGGVQRDNRVQAAEGETCRRGDRVLFGDADVEDAVRDAAPRARAARSAAAWRR